MATPPTPYQPTLIPLNNREAPPYRASVDAGIWPWLTATLQLFSCVWRCLLNQPPPVQPSSPCQTFFLCFPKVLTSQLFYYPSGSVLCLLRAYVMTPILCWFCNSGMVLKILAECPTILHVCDILHHKILTIYWENMESHCSTMYTLV